MDEVWKDERFKHIGVNPRFRNISKREKKVKIDKRFRSMFTDDRFQLKYSVDRKGRPVSRRQTDDYRKYYDISSSSDTDGDDEEIKFNEGREGASDLVTESSEKDITARNNQKSLNHDIEGPSGNDGGESILTDKMKFKIRDMNTDYARGVGIIRSDGSSSDESSSEESESEMIEHPWGELDEDAETTDEATRRLAVCNMDWDRITATDLMVLFTSFLPSDGVIESVTIYPSEFGEQRMQEEELKGPKELVELKADPKEDYVCDDKGSKFETEKLRDYQLKRLKYYYGVAVFNSGEVAQKVYTECDGKEYESSATKLDLRFVPENMEFKQEPREVCHSLPDTSKYKPRLFANTALQQGKVDLTWDETNPDRVDFNKKIGQGEEVNEEILKEYLATSSEEESGEEEEKFPENRDEEFNENDKISKYRSLLTHIKESEYNKKQSKMEMEITWGADLKEKTDKILEEKGTKKIRGKIKIQKSVSDNLLSDDELPSDVDKNDPFFSKSLKKKEKLKRKLVASEDSEDGAENQNTKTGLDLLMGDDVKTDIKHFNLQTIQSLESEGKRKKGKWKKQLKKKKIDSLEAASEKANFKINLEDDRFKALYDSHLFNIDPADPHFRKTRAMEELIKEKQKRKKQSTEQRSCGSQPGKSGI